MKPPIDIEVTTSLPPRSPNSPKEFYQCVSYILKSYIGYALSMDITRAMEHKLSNLVTGCIFEKRFSAYKYPNIVVRGPWVTDNETQARNKAFNKAVELIGKEDGLEYGIHNDVDCMRYELNSSGDRTVAIYEYSGTLSSSFRNDQVNVFIFCNGKQLQNISEIWRIRHETMQR